MLSSAFELRKTVTEVGCAPHEVGRGEKAHSANLELSKIGSANCLTGPSDTELLTLSLSFHLGGAGGHISLCYSVQAATQSNSLRASRWKIISHIWLDMQGRGV